MHLNGPRHIPVTLRQLAIPAASDNFDETLLASLAHLQSLANLFEGGNRSRDGYGAAHALILDQIDRLIHGRFGNARFLLAEHAPPVRSSR